jgi:hypothetical protein
VRVRIRRYSKQETVVTRRSRRDSARTRSRGGRCSNRATCQSGGGEAPPRISGNHRFLHTRLEKSCVRWSRHTGHCDVAFAAARSSRSAQTSVSRPAASSGRCAPSGVPVVGGVRDVVARFPCAAEGKVWWRSAQSASPGRWHGCCFSGRRHDHTRTPWQPDRP